MTITPFTVDGKQYNALVTSLKRKAAVLDGDNAGRTQDARMHRDVRGTFYNYTVAVDTKGVGEAAYDELYEALTAPVDSHVVTFPYGQNTLTFEAYIANAEDDLLRMTEAKNLWGKLTFQITAMSPQRRPG